MLTEPLPSTLDVRKAAARGVSVSGSLNPEKLERFQALLASSDGVISAQLSFSRDEDNRSLVRVVTSADVEVTCQRCLGPMPLHIEGDNTLAVVWSDDQAKHLPRSLDPLVLGEENCELWDLVEEELMLAMPAFSYHDSDQCKEVLADFSGEAPVEEAPERPNPFDVLEQLKPGK